MSARVIRPSDVEMTHRGGPPGLGRVGRAISSDDSPSMSAGFAEFDQCSIAWQVHYDEIVYVIEGIFRLVIEKDELIAHPGDIMWIPKGTRLSYEGDKAKLFYVVYPGNWREIKAAEDAK
ncbi:cupin domain-containing protein [Ahrensia kielensis]|uniref:Cupin domain-containing protein n=1 Tax=Ahrensia kielensis TaxID=76980 RepID=A0ABU9T2Q5_9HYPH